MPLHSCNGSKLSYSTCAEEKVPKLKMKPTARKQSFYSLNPGADSVQYKKHFTRDLVRDIILQRTEQPGLVALVTPEKLSHLRNKAKVITKEERVASIQKQQNEKEKLEEASRLRKAKLEEFDLIRKQNEKLNDLELEAQKQTEYLCQKANEVRQEQEEEIKEINELILASKVQAIRDDQMAEKVMIKVQRKKADTELDEMMEKERVEGLRKEEEKAKMRHQDALESAGLLIEQIQGNHENRLLEKAKKAQEGEAMRSHFEKMQEEDIENEKQRKIQQKQFLDTLVHENKEILKLKQISKEQSKQEDIMIAAYQRMKIEKEEAAEAELKEQKYQRELQIAKLRAQQERASDLQAEKDALRARRAQEEKEREYRRKEKENVLKKKQVEEDLLKSRTEQLEMQNRLILLKAEEENKDFQAMVQRNNREAEAEEIRNMKGHLGRIKNSKQLLRQIEEHEKKLIAERKNFFLEGLHKKQEDKLRKQRLDNLKLKKLNDLKNYDIPKQYLAHIQRKLNLQMEK